MAIVSSQITSNNLEVDGRRRIDELHIDDQGAQFSFTYLADVGVDADAQLASRATALPTMCANSEIALNIANVKRLGSLAVPVFKYSTLTQNAVALSAAYIGATHLEVIMMGDFIASLPDVEIEAALGLTTDQVSTLRTTQLIPAAATAAAIRGAIGTAV